MDSMSSGFNFEDRPLLLMSKFFSCLNLDLNNNYSSLIYKNTCVFPILFLRNVAKCCDRFILYLFIKVHSLCKNMTSIAADGKNILQILNTKKTQITQYKITFPSV